MEKCYPLFINFGLINSEARQARLCTFSKRISTQTTIETAILLTIRKKKMK